MLNFCFKDKWSEMFCPIVSSAKTIQIISSGASGPSGTLLLVSNYSFTIVRMIKVNWLSGN